ncbi:uncharacterized protein LOC135848706 [Planococcus citri]|uniref:uncharacterized protein LOC135848706 n=1 Tax=Planococcus citri TaxID=170843 RepID=UPI0031FA4535
MRRIIAVTRVTFGITTSILVFASFSHQQSSCENQPVRQSGKNPYLSSDGTGDDENVSQTGQNQAEAIDSWEERDRQRLLHDIEKKKNLIMFGLDSTDMDDHSLRMLVVQMLQATEINFESSEVVSIQKLPKNRFPHPPILVKLISGSLQSMIIRNKVKLHQYNIRLEHDLDSKTIRKQKRLLPLRNKLLEAHLPQVFIRYGKLFVNNRVLNSQEVEQYAQQYGVKLAPRSRR